MGAMSDVHSVLYPILEAILEVKSIDSLIKEAELLAANGVKEIILVAQDTTNYGVDLWKADAA